MKLRKALDKAKKEREEFGPESIDEPAILEDDELLKEQAGGWKSPTYTESKTIRLDPNKLSENRCVCIFPSAPELDAYKVLRTQIQQRTKDQKLNTIMITSVNPGEGTTLTTINLAITFAKEFNQTVLLVDGDLKKQDIHKLLAFQSNAGLADYLLEDKSLADLIVWPGIEKMTVISGGKTLQDSTELLGSPRMKDLVAEMKSRYEDRYIFFDVPPILDGADAIAFAPLVDGILIVIESGKTSMADIRRALDLIPRTKMLGFVLNRHNE
jgi:non-specific protein-tyrosine kinase